MATQKKKPAPVKKTAAQKSKTLKASPASVNKKSTAKAKVVPAAAKNKVVAQKPMSKAKPKHVAAPTKPTPKNKTVVSSPKQVIKTNKNNKVNKSVKPIKAAIAKPTKVNTDKKSALKLSKAKPVIKNNPKPVPTKKSAKPVVKTGPKKLSTMKKTEEKIPKETINKKKSAIAAKPVPVKKEEKTTKKVVAAKTSKKSAEEKAPKKTYALKPLKTLVTDKKKASEENPVKAKPAPAAKAEKKEPKKPAKPFVMPKVNTDKSREYKPAFTKSVLDQAPEEYSGPTMRYSDNDLIEFRELITKKVDTAKKELGYLQGLITRKDQLGGDENENRYMTMEDGGLSMEREQLSQMASRQINFIDHLEKAMMRIENKTYGICRVTGKLIDKARLRAVPHATLSIEAKIGRANSNV